MRDYRKRLSSRSVFAILLAVSIVLIILPTGFTGRFMGFVQILAPFQGWATRGLDAAVAANGGDEASAEVDTLRRRNAALEHQVMSLASRHFALAKDFESVAGIRLRGLDGGRLIPARVVAGDALPWRQSRLIISRLLGGVARGSIVASNRFSVALPEVQGVRSGSSVLAGEVLVGFVDQVATRSARIRLITDRATKMPVVIARLERSRFLPLDAQFWLVGTGSPTLEVRDVDHRRITSGAIKNGDTVLSVPTDARLPASLTIGVVTDIQPDPENRLLYVLTVEPAVNVDEIRRVFVVDPQGDTG